MLRSAAGLGGWTAGGPPAFIWFTSCTTAEASSSQACFNRRRLMYETRRDRLLTRAQFTMRVLVHISIAVI
ncbi:MAG: hypothetical protein M3P29_10975, partial [Acidobacteriota bacterium]|nr:hypothetical protein [Acidobacteriota bacterium]